MLRHPFVQGIEARTATLRASPPSMLSGQASIRANSGSFEIVSKHHMSAKQLLTSLHKNAQVIAPALTTVFITMSDLYNEGTQLLLFFDCWHPMVFVPSVLLAGPFLILFQFIFGLLPQYVESGGSGQQPGS
jgi:hypothetical protein